MKNRKTIYGCLASSALLFSHSVMAQIPVEQEPHHKIVFENEYVRLFDLYIAVGDTTLTHTHAAASVVVFLTKSAFGIHNFGDTPSVRKLNVFIASIR